MTFLLSSQNVFEYLIKQGLCTQEDRSSSKIERKTAKNFNLLLTLPGGRQLLVKQELHDREGKTAREFLREWRVQEFLQRFPEHSYLRTWLPEILHFDESHSIIVFNYLTDYRDLIDFYTKENIFPTTIATSIGTLLATIHRVTLDRLDYQEFFSQKSEDESINQAPHLIRVLDRIGPEVFGLVPADGLRFFALYQRYDSLGQAIKELSAALEPCCLIHNDLKLNNILLSNSWQQAVSTCSPLDSLEVRAARGDGIIRLIDWERSTWGDPAFDLGMLISSYLLIWLSSLVTSKAIAIEESLRLAMIPLEELQHSIAALTSAYLSHFPEILERRPDFLQRVVQFAGMCLINAIQATLQHQKFFGNPGICILQVAKSLLCRPEQSMLTVFGLPASELLRFSYSSV